MATHLVCRNARSMPWVAEETLAPVRGQGSTNHDVGPRTSKSPSPSEDLGTPTHLISSPRPMPRSKKCPKIDGENPGL